MLKNNLSWFFDYLEKTNSPIIKIGNLEKVISDFKKISDFEKFFKDSKKEMQKLNKQYTDGELTKDKYDKIKNQLIENDYTILDSHAEFYLYQDPKLNVKTTKYIYCECLSVRDENTGKKILLYAYFDAGIDGKIGNEFEHGTTTQNFLSFSNSLASSGLAQFDATYYATKPITSNFSEVENYVLNIKKSQ